MSRVSGELSQLDRLFSESTAATRGPCAPVAPTAPAAAAAASACRAALCGSRTAGGSVLAGLLAVLDARGGSAAAPTAATSTGSPATAPEPARPKPPAAPRPESDSDKAEFGWIGKLLAVAGVAVTLIGVVLLLVLAAQAGLLRPEIRVAGGTALAIAPRRRGRPAARSARRPDRRDRVGRHRYCHRLPGRHRGHHHLQVGAGAGRAADRPPSSAERAWPWPGDGTPNIWHCWCWCR